MSLEQPSVTRLSQSNEGPLLKSASRHGATSEDIVTTYPMTRSQEGLWIAYCISPRATHHDLILKFTFSRKLQNDLGFSLEALTKAIKTLTIRHSILRSTFHSADKNYERPYIAEGHSSSASANFRILTRPHGPGAEGQLWSFLRKDVNISVEYAVRWTAVLSEDSVELYLVSHHIALDGKSMSRLSQELWEILVVPSGTISEDMQYQPFRMAHIAENSFLNSSAFDAAKEFWMSQSRNVRPIKWKRNKTESSSSGQNYRESQTWFEFSKKELLDWGNQYEASWFRVALALVGVLIRSLAEPDGGVDHALMVAFGGRPVGMEDSVGQFANAVPIRIPLADACSSKTPTFGELVRLVSRSVSAGKIHERFSYLDIVDVHRKIGLQPPPAQVAITFSPKLSRQECKLYPVEGVYDLFFCFLEHNSTVTLEVIYDPLLFLERDIRALKETFSTLRKLYNGKSAHNLSEILWLTPHFSYMLTDIDLGNVEEIDSIRFHGLFENRVAHDPKALALYSHERNSSVTYQHLNEEANRKAHYLRKIGIGRASVVLLYLSRDFRIMEWIIAVLKSGAAFVVADQKRPVEYTCSIIAISDPAVIIRDNNGHNLSKLSVTTQAHFLDTDNTLFDDMPIYNLKDITMNDDLAYISFTSGSTGQPKGVEIEHRNLSHFIINAYSSNYVSLSPGSRVLQWATFAFDAAVIEWAQCLTLGGTLCFVDVPEALTGDYLADVIESNEISFINVTASVLATLPTSRTLPSLRQISVGGEMVPENVLSTWRTRVLVQNAYGPTECTAVMSHHSQPRSVEERQPAAGNVGLPHRHTKFLVSNESFTRLLGFHEDGEVCIAGPQVGRGYRGRADLTASKFSIHPELGDRVYRTGDRGRLLPDGSVYLIGRIDREVKIRGYRIDLDSVETTVYEVMPGIVGVSLQMDESTSSLIAFIAPRDIDHHLLRKKIAERLPDYMVPKTIYTLEKLPLNAHKKIDHKAVTARMDKFVSEAIGLIAESSPIIPSSPSKSLDLEPSYEVDVISKIWKNILDLPQTPSVSANFFDLGGNSLSVQKLANSLKVIYPQIELSITDLFSKASIEGQLQLIADRISRPDSLRSMMLREKSVPPVPANDVVEATISNIWKTALQVDELDPVGNLFDVGGNSILVSQVLGNINRRWPCLDFKMTDLFRHVTVRRQSELISERLQKLTLAQIRNQRSLSNIPEVAQSPSFGHEIAIVGLAGRFPGASSPDELFQLFLEKRDGLKLVPMDKVETEPFKDAMYIPMRGAIDDVEQFNHASWGINEEDARNMDPQQRLFLDVTREALNDFGHFPSPEGYNNVGIVVGAAHDTWSQHQIFLHDRHTTRAAPMKPSISARTAYHLNLHGPNVTLNTACSSGLVAMSLAIDQLRLGHCDMSIAGGVSVAFPQQGYFAGPNQLYSPSGHCRPFDHMADGTVPGDAVCALVLRRLEDAIRDGDKIYSIVSGIAVGSDGKTERAGILSPSARGQANTILRAWKDSNLSPSKHAYAELHGSGTPIGDAIELEGLNISRFELNVHKTPITIGSNKGNIGNCEAAGGLISVIKMCKSMKNGIIPPVQSFEKMNTMIANDPSVTVASSEITLSPDAIVSVSSIGLGGVNAHCILRFPPSVGDG